MAALPPLTAAGGLNVAALGLRQGQPIYMGEGIALDPDASPPLPGYVRLYATTGPLQSLDLLTASDFRPVEFGASWEPIERAQRSDVPAYRGDRLYAQDGLVLLDAYGTGADVQREWQALERMTWRPRGHLTPPVLRVAGPVHHPEWRWTATVEAGDDENDVIWDGNRLVRVLARLILTRHLSFDLADDDDEPEGRGRRSRDRSVPKSIQAREGDTLRRIAKRVLGSARRWKDIRDAPGNKGLRDPDRKLRKGTQVWLP